MAPRPLTSDRKGAPKGDATSVVIFVHGYGANGADLLGLADPLAPHMPKTAFYALMRLRNVRATRSDSSGFRSRGWTARLKRQRLQGKRKPRRI